MTTTIGGIHLGITAGDNLVLTGLDGAEIDVDTQRSDHGHLQILVATRDGGRELQLEGTITAAQEASLVAMAKAGATVMLIHPRFTGEVLIIGLEFAAADLTDYVNPPADSWRDGTINLIEV